MPEIIKERMLIVWKTEGPEKGQFQGAHIDELIRYEDGSTRNRQRPLTESDADDLVGSIDTTVATQLEAKIAEIAALTEAHTQEIAGKDTTIAEKDALLSVAATEKTQLETQLATKDARIANLMADIEAGNESNAATIATKDAQIAKLTESLSEKTNEVVTTTSQLVAMTVDRDFWKRKIYDPRKLTVTAFQARFTQKQILDIAVGAVTDPVLASILETFKAHKIAGLLFNLDAEAAQGGVNYLVMKGIVTEEYRNIVLLRDSTQDEQIDTEEETLQVSQMMQAMP